MITVKDMFLGGLIPWIKKVSIALNKDGSMVDTGLVDADDEIGYYRCEGYFIEWGYCRFPVSAQKIFETETNRELTEKEIQDLYGNESSE